MTEHPPRIPAVTPDEVARLDAVLAGAGRRLTGADLARRGGRYRLVDRQVLVKELLQLVDSFVVERIRQAERELARILEAREGAAHDEGRHRVLVSLAELADLVDAIVQKAAGTEASNAARSLDRRIDRVFKSFGFERIDTVGSLFDSAIHEAIDERTDNDVQPGTILEEVARGYRRESFVLRVARVIVAE